MDRTPAEIHIEETVHSLPHGEFRMLTWNFHPRLRPFVRRAGAYIEPGGGMQRRELPLVGSPLILTNHVPYLLSEAIDPDRPVRQVQGFLAGMHETYTSSRAIGPTEAFQIDLTPFAAHRFVRGNMRELRNRLVPVSDLLDGSAAGLEDRVWNEPAWPARIRVLEAALIERIADAPVESPRMIWFWRQLQRWGTGLDLAAAAAELGWSQKHLIAKSHEVLGLSPKLVARQMRFERAVALMREGGRGGTFAKLAHRLGYADQAHFSREFREFAGVTPTQFVRDDGAAGIALRDGSDS